MGDPAEKRRRPTYADIEALPAHVVGEIIAGELVVMPRPAPRHAHAASVLGVVLGGPFHLGSGGPGGWWILHEPELQLGVDADYEPVVPDLAGWRRERLPELPDTAYFALVPDWICEVLSPSTASLDRAEKLPFYGRATVAHAWLVDPGARTLEAYTLDTGAWRLLGTWRDGARVRCAPFDSIEIDLASLWAAPSRRAG